MKSRGKERAFARLTGIINYWMPNLDKIVKKKSDVTKSKNGEISVTTLNGGQKSAYSIVEVKRDETVTIVCADNLD